MLDADAERVAEEAVFCLVVARALVEGDSWKSEIAEERAVLMAFNIDVTEVVGRARREEKKKERKLGVEDASLTVLRTTLLFVLFAAQVGLSSLSLSPRSPFSHFYFLYAFDSCAASSLPVQPRARQK